MDIHCQGCGKLLWKEEEIKPNVTYSPICGDCLGKALDDGKRILEKEG